MKKHFTLALAALGLCLSLKAQSPYTLTATTAIYAPLAGATSVNGTTKWDTQFFTMPVGFNAKLGSHTVSKVFTDGTDLYSDTTGTSVDLFQSFFAHSIDRGTTTSLSPLRYMTTGAAPNRIFKYEVAGGGFYAEQQMHGTYLDSFNVQFWVFETSNVIELHFGPAKISHPTEYFDTTGKPGYCGYFNVSFTSGPNFGYFAAGSPTAPFMDSITATHNPLPLNSYPASGTVYRFTPRSTTGVASVNAPLQASLFPTICTSSLTITLMETDAVSYELMGINGAVVSQGALQHGSNALDVTGLAAGTYIVRLQSAGHRAFCRFIKQ